MPGYGVNTNGITVGWRGRQVCLITLISRRGVEGGEKAHKAEEAHSGAWEAMKAGKLERDGKATWN